MATFNPQDWTLGFDEFNRICWYNKATKSKAYPQLPTEAPAGLSTIDRAGPNIPTAAPFTPASGLVQEALLKEALSGAWKEYQTDDDDKKTYWHNEISGETKWERPTTISPRKPPPPPSPESTPPAPKEPSPHTARGAGKEKKKEKKDERDQWKQLRNSKGRRYWYNEETRESQYETPTCLRKYR